MKIRHWLYIAVSVFTIAGIQSCKNGSSGNPVMLKLNIEPGVKYKYTQKMNVELNMIGNSTTQNADISFQYDVAGANGADKKLTMTFTKFIANMVSPLGNVDYNSDQQKDQSIQHPFSMTVSQSGEVKKVEGLEFLQDKLMMGGGQDANVASLLAGTFSDSAISNLMRPIFNIYPEKAVRPGDIWTKESSVNVSGVSMKLAATYKLVNIKNGIANIDINTKITSGGGSISTPGMEVKIDVSGTSKGKMEVDVATGTLKSSTEEQNIEGNMSAGGMQAPVKMMMKTSTVGEKL